MLTVTAQAEAGMETAGASTQRKRQRSPSIEFIAEYIPSASHRVKKLKQLEVGHIGSFPNSSLHLEPQGPLTWVLTQQAESRSLRDGGEVKDEPESEADASRRVPIDLTEELRVRSRKPCKFDFRGGRPSSGARRSSSECTAQVSSSRGGSV